MLNEREQQQLARIECELAEGDPELAEQLESHRIRRPRRRGVLVGLGILVGGVVGVFCGVLVVTGSAAAAALSGLAPLMVTGRLAVMLLPGVAGDRGRGRRSKRGRNPGPSDEPQS